jgi:molecular chaperone DnaK
MAKDNVSLGQFNLVGIPPAPRGVPQIEVTFDIDASGILNVSAKDLGTGKAQSMTITASTKLPGKEVEKLVSEAKKFEEQDRKQKEEIEVRNAADSLIYTTEKTLADLGEKLPADAKEKIESAMKSAKDAMAEKDTGKLKQEMERLQKVLQEAGSVIYQEAAKQQAGPQAAPGAGQEQSSSGSGGDKVIDADFKVEEEK